MKIKFFGRTAFAAVALAMAFAPCTQAASGWTDFGTISELNQNPSISPGNELVFFKASVTNNPSDPAACSVRNGFYPAVTTDLQKRLFAMLMMAKATDKRVQMYVTANCHMWGYAEIQGITFE